MKNKGKLQRAPQRIPSAAVSSWKTADVVSHHADKQLQDPALTNLPDIFDLKHTYWHHKAHEHRHGRQDIVLLAENYTLQQVQWRK